MSFWSMPLPNYIKNSRTLSGDEKELFLRIMENRNELGWCGRTNKEFAKCFGVHGVSERTISTWISNLEKHGFISISNSRHNNQRHIYCNIPKKAPAMPDYNKDMSIDDYLKIFTLAFPANENEIQENISVEQANFLRSFRAHFPHKKLDCQITDFHVSNYTELMLQCKRSTLIRDADNLGLKWVLENAEAIMADEFGIFDEEHNRIRQQYEDAHRPLAVAKKIRRDVSKLPFDPEEKGVPLEAYEQDVDFYKAEKQNKKQELRQNGELKKLIDPKTADLFNRTFDILEG